MGEISAPEIQNRRMIIGCFPWKFQGGEAAFARVVAFDGAWPENPRGGPLRSEGASRRMKYDDADWHHDGPLEAGSPERFAGTHIALMLKWCFLRGWASDRHLGRNPADVEKLLRGEMSATEYLFRWCDGKLLEQDLNAEGNAFMSVYYGRDGEFLKDYEREFPDHMYVVGEAGHDFAKFSRMVEARYRSFADAPERR